MMVVPTKAVPSQTLQIQLGGQACTIDVFTTSNGLFMDLLVANAQVISGVLCENLNRIVRSLYLGFAGDFVFFDTQGTDDPEWEGLGTRWFLVYLEASDLPAGEG